MKLVLFGAAAVAAAAFVTPALAQATISNPGNCAQFFQNASCTSYRPGKPYTDGDYYRNDTRQNGMAMQTVDNNAYRYHGGPKYND
jgi:hypothetical protein